ncbi:sn-glycerol-3-phosphate ABC transporter permease UgpA [Burkholderiaceae bacterium FT117]|uniref:sn-glycerol-3-phosphate ABC transporter permease UgpA n=1 Tax=Zeimonas sediminis TaxID=2944268 RepID=UPI002342BE77|nr:sn-glycerol-3-phosphate ABC transporter permease UgpA [Zeimonas sediminis]MCM5569532.1 sn-glycerol-3-phosphate ABC transporter permease UgpA [Zeimonas sediminis]
MEKRVVFRGRWLPVALIAPQIAIILVFFYWPAIQALVQSVFIQDAFGGRMEFVGLENFEVLFADELYLNSFRITAIFSVAVAAIGLVTSLALAYFADRAIRGALAFRTMLIIPYAVAPAIVGVLWMFLFNPTLGIVAHWLRGFGIDWNHVLDGDQAMILVIIAAVWKQISYNFIFFLAGLQSIPKSLIEAAALDGAGAWRTFRSVIFPLLSPTTFFLLVINVVYAFFDTFAIIDAATEGGPAKATEILVYKVFYDGFKALDIGSSAAQSVVLMAIVLVLTFVQFRFIERRVQY